MLKKIRNWLLVITALALVCLPACSGGPPLYEVTDQLGRHVGMRQVPERIVSLDPGVTETLYAMGLEDRVVGVSTDSDFPAEAREKTLVGDISVIDMEKLVDLKPDLVIIVTFNEGLVVPRLEAEGLTVFGLAAFDLQGMLDGITLIGEVTREQAAAARLVGDLEARIKVITDKRDAVPEDQRPVVFFLVYPSPLYTAGQGTIEDDLIEKAGGRNIGHELFGYKTLYLQEVIDANPQVMISVFEVRVGLESDLAYEFLTTDPELAVTDARKNGRVWAIWSVIVSRIGPRLVNGLEELNLLIYIEPPQP